MVVCQVVFQRCVVGDKVYSELFEEISSVFLLDLLVGESEEAF